MIIGWQGVSIDVSHVPNWLNSDFDHIELRCDTVLPVTKPGYRSHFIHKKQIALIGGSEDFVTQRLDEQAKDPGWRKRQVAAQQLALL